MNTCLCYAVRPAAIFAFFSRGPSWVDLDSLVSDRVCDEFISVCVCVPKMGGVKLQHHVNRLLESQLLTEQCQYPVRSVSQADP